MSCTEDDEGGNMGSAKKRTSVEGSLSLNLNKKLPGRPPGSKNKPKSPSVITLDSERTIKTHILKLPDGCNIVQCLMSFSQKNQVGISVLSATGAVANVSLHEGRVVTLLGRFELLSLSGSYFPQPSPHLSPRGFSVSLAAHNGQVVGGRVGAFLSAVGTVIIVIASFANPSYHNFNYAKEEQNGNDNRTIAPAATLQLAQRNEYSPLPGSSQMNNVPATGINSGQISPPRLLSRTDNRGPR